MCDFNTADSCWLADFSCRKKEEILEGIELSFEEYNWDESGFYIIHHNGTEPHDDAYKKACKVSSIRYCLESGFAKDVLSEEEADKCAENFRQKQYKFKLFNKLLAKFCCFIFSAPGIGWYTGDSSDLRNQLTDILKSDIRRYARKFRDEEVEKGYAPLKKQIEKITSGVKGRCYLAGENVTYRKHDEEYKSDKAYKRMGYSNYIFIDEALNASLIKKYCYDFNKIHKGYSPNGFKLINSMFCKVLLDDNSFWEKHDKFDVICFIKSVKDFNGQAHAEKILFYIFDEIKKSNEAEAFIKNSIPLDILDRNLVNEDLEKQTKWGLFYRYKEFYSNVEDENFCYPFSQVVNAETKMKEGKKLVNKFFKEIYPNDWQKVYDFIDNGLNKGAPIMENNGLNMAGLMDIASFNTLIKYKKAIGVFCPEYFSPENVWNRFYLKMYVMKEISGDEKTFCTRAFENFYYLIDIFNKKLDINTAYQRNVEGRDATFKKLKDILSRYEIEPTEKFKENYIVSLLDERVALINESAKFAVLEQLGDAIYGFAVAENLFYNMYKIDCDTEEYENIALKFENFTRAEAQIEIVNKIGLDKLFLSPALLGGSEAIIQPPAQYGKVENKYLADMLEMVIGSVCIEFGYQKAIEFVKKLLKETYPDKFIKEVRWFDDVSDNEECIVRYYWTTMRPALYCGMGSCHSVLWRALDKVVKVLVIGTEDKESREYLTYSVGDGKAYGDKGYSTGDVSMPFYDYLQNGNEGLNIVLKKYSAKLKEYYEKQKIGYSD